MNIIITGGASGLGEAITKKLADNDQHKLLMTYCHSKDQSVSISKQFFNVRALYCDFTNQDHIDQLCKEMMGFDPDVLVNNALASFTKNHFHKIDPDEFLNSFKYNILPVIQITQQAIKIFRKKKWGKIINILTSYLESKQPVGLSEYMGQKSYLASLSRSWALENQKFNITSNSISPSFMQTALNKDVDDRLVEQMIADHPDKKLLTVEQAADCVDALINSSQEMNGHNIVL